jgi:uncharacterized membrane protein HdeD (DUF308 family)
MTPDIVRIWWLLALRGALAVVFGLAALVWPAITLGLLVFLFGLYVLTDGICSVASALRVAGARAQGWPLLAEGEVSIGLGVLAWTRPLIPPVLLYLIASWGIITGVLEIIAAMRLSHEATTQWLLGLSGGSSILLGMLLMILPGGATSAVARVVGTYALIFGILLLGGAVRLRRWRLDSPLATMG